MIMKIVVILLIVFAVIAVLRMLGAKKSANEGEFVSYMDKAAAEVEVVDAEYIVEDGDCTIILTDAGRQKIKIIKVVREITGLGLKEGKELVDNTPSTLMENISQKYALSLQKKIEEFGGTVEINKM
jgi:ribosomal protein L7/L12